MAGQNVKLIIKGIVYVTLFKALACWGHQPPLQDTCSSVWSPSFLHCVAQDCTTVLKARLDQHWIPQDYHLFWPPGYTYVTHPRTWLPGLTADFHSAERQAAPPDLFLQGCSPATWLPIDTCAWHSHPSCRSHRLFLLILLLLMLPVLQPILMPLQGLLPLERVSGTTQFNWVFNSCLQIIDKNIEQSWPENWAPRNGASDWPPARCSPVPCNPLNSDFQPVLHPAHGICPQGTHTVLPQSPK